jgi:osmoprotectant transport system ATP-binding protein
VLDSAVTGEEQAGTEPAVALAALAVAKIYADGTRALAGVSLEVQAGETLALVGESGSGKTTLLRLFNRMVEPTAGEVRVGGRMVASLDPIGLRRRIGYVPQDGGLLPHWRVERNVELVPRLLGWEPGRRRARTREMLLLVGLDPAVHAGRYPAELSGGQRQRVAFARALAADPPVVLLDEPFGALDALTRLELHRQFLDLKRRLRKTMVLVTHDLGEAFRLGDRIGVMRQGSLLQLGPPAELLAQPADSYVRELLALRTVAAPGAATAVPPATGTPSAPPAHPGNTAVGPA